MNLLEELLPNKNQTHELELFMSSHFGSSHQKSGTNKITHGDSIEVEYYGTNNKTHSSYEIKSIKILDNFSKSKINDFLLAAKEALSIENGNAIGQKYAFSPYEVKGNYRYKNREPLNKSETNR